MVDEMTSRKDLICKSLSHYCVRDYLLFSFNEDKDSYSNGRYYISCQDNGDDAHSVFLIDPIAYRFLISWVSDNGCMESWIFATQKVLRYAYSVILHLVKIREAQSSSGFIAIVESNPFEVPISHITIDRNTHEVRLYSRKGVLTKERYKELSGDEKLCLFETSKGITIKEIARLCCWSESKARKLRTSILDKLHSNNIVLALRTNELFNVAGLENLLQFR